jgi:hypothetical protein
MDKLDGAILLLHAEPAGVVGYIGALINASCKFVFENLNNIIQDSGRDRNVLVYPRYVFNNRDFDGGKIIIAKAFFFSFGPS